MEPACITSRYPKFNGNHFGLPPALSTEWLSIAWAILHLHIHCRQMHNIDVLANSGLASPSPKTVSAVVPSAWQWSSLSAHPSSPSCVILFLLFQQPFVAISSVLPYFSSFKVFFFLLLFCLILCLSLLFLAPPSAHFCMLFISFLSS